MSFQFSMYFSKILSPVSVSYRVAPASTYLCLCNLGKLTRTFLIPVNYPNSVNDNCKRTNVPFNLGFMFPLNICIYIMLGVFLSKGYHVT